MNDATLPDLGLWYVQLYEPAPPPGGEPRPLDILNRTHTGAIFRKRLASRWGEIQALPPSVSGTGRPFAEALAEADDDHDDFHDAIALLLAAIVKAPSTPEALRAVAAALAERVVPDPKRKSASYADEASHAPSYRELLASQADQLAAFPLAWEGPERTLGSWVEGLATQAEALGDLLKARSMAQTAAQTAADRKRAGAIRTLTLGTIRDCRAALAVELEEHPELPQDLDRLVFGYLDDLSAERTARKKTRQRAKSGSGANGGGSGGGTAEN